MLFNTKQTDDQLIRTGFMELLESMFLIGLVLDIEGTVKYVNPHFLRITGYKKEDVVGKNWFDLFVPIKKIDTVKKTFEIITREKYKMRSENPILAKDGSEIVIEWHNSPLMQGNNVIGSVSIGVDITGRIEIEKMLKTTEESSRLHAHQVEEQNKVLNDTKKGMLNLLDDSNRLQDELQKEKKSVERKVIERTTELNQEKARLEAAINSVPSGFLVTDKKGGVLIKNASLSEIFNGLSPDECTIEKLDVLLTNVNLLDDYKRCIDERKPINIRDITFGKKILDIYMAPIFISQISPEIIGVILLISDVTEEKVLARSKDEFFSIASHELRTPITAIRGNIELITKYYTDKVNDPSFRQMLDDMKESSIRLIHLVNEFLNTSRLEQGKIVFNVTDFNLQEVIETVVNDLEVSAKNKGVSLQNDTNADLPKVKADSEKTKEVLINLVGNAIAYTDKGSISITAAQEDKFIKVSVKDSGKGIPEQNQQLLFRKFQQANTNIYARDISNSTGLGLYISKLLVESMGGKIYLESSEVGKGSTFVFTLPLALV
ncbi:PAS domain S-box protein [candidate division WWE3 bacterium]|uniref:histidine kinase n=1 Tax=candidate division WWE3 bacterium TaxID=2053526 RepID=A0A7X9DKW0_UNCKA|nr:PAS domain S-box protein [candidate division WWE3 bacterium]